MICAREGCEQPVPIKEPSRGGFQARYCSANCIKRACDDRNRATCIDCGAALCTRSGWRQVDHKFERCWTCDVAARKARERVRLEQVAEWYRAGMTQRQIAAALGYGSNSIPPEICKARKLGLIGYRNRGYGNAA